MSSHTDAQPPPPEAHPADPAPSEGHVDEAAAGTERVVTLPEEERESLRSSLTGWAVTIAVAVVLTLIVKSFILQAYSIPSPSMVPTLQLGDRVVVFQLNHDPARGDIIVFDRPPNDPKTNPDDPDVLIKRVIGLPGETITAQDGHVFVDGKRLVEAYLPKGTETLNFSSPITVPEGKLLVLGDNRTESFDGRYFGPIDKDLVVGRAIARIWPPSRIGGL